MESHSDPSTGINKEALLGKLSLAVSRNINCGLDYKSILDTVFDVLDTLIPFDRIGIAVCENEKKDITLKWVKSKVGVQHLNLGFSVPMQGSSLGELAKTRCPRIIDDLESYAREHPNSYSTCKIIKDGIRSNLTIPLLIKDDVIGFAFFSSATKNTYNSCHIEVFSEIAEELAMLVRYGQLYNSFATQENNEQMLRTTIHELRSPLAIIQGYLNLFNDEQWFRNLPSSEKELFDVLHRNVKVMFHLIGDLAEAEWVRSGSLALHLQVVNIRQFLSDIFSQNLILVQKKRCRLESNFADDLPESGIFDPMRIQQVLNNLIGNAVKFSQPGTDILIKCSFYLGTLVFSVADNGPGIPADEMKVLFREFGKTSVKPTGGESSTGLGLAICRHIVDAHCGKIEAASRVGHGSTFTFWLPITKSGDHFKI